MNAKSIKQNFLKDKNIVLELTKKKVKSQYRNSFLGIIWSVLNPLLNTLIMYIVFKDLFKYTDQYFVLYLLCGNILFQALRSSTTSALTSIVANRGLLLKIKIKEGLFPLASVFASITNFAFSLIALLIMILFLQIKYGVVIFGYQMLFILLFLPAFMLFVYGIGLALSALYVFFRDIQYIYSVFLTLWTYLTPIFYKINRFGEKSFALKIVKLNPMYYFVEYFRDCVYLIRISGSYGTPSLSVLLGAYAIGFVSLGIGLILFKMLRKHFMYYI